MRLPHGLVALTMMLGLAAGARDHLDRVIDRTVLPPVLSETSVEMRDAQGQLLRVFPVEGGRFRLPVRPEEVDPRFIDQLIAYEDKRFWHHAGVDPRAILRASWQNLRAGTTVSGGSTLSMQVARLLENSGTGRWPGKWRQMRVALALERRLSKQDILRLYLIHAPYGGALEGVRAGTWAWFGKEPARLTPAEAALLIALPQSPETRRPDRNPDAARHARDRVLARVGEPADPRTPVPVQMRPFPRLAPHLTDRIYAEDPARLRHDLTVDARLQTQLQALAGRAVTNLAPNVSAAILVADHHNGAILASVGSPLYDADRQGFVDMTRAVRSPGSTLKPLIYGMAFDQGLVHPETLINDEPVQFGRYAPQNFDGMFRGDVTVREALQLSLNIPPVLLTEELGPARVMAGLRQAGAAPRVAGKPGLAIALGGIGLSLHDLVEVYGMVARGGISRPLHARKGSEPETGVRALSASASWQVAHILAGLTPPRGQAARLGQVAYKTGTSYGHRDAWAIGFDGTHVIGVWLGRPDGTPVPGAFGGDLAAPVLFSAFNLLAAQRSPLPPPPPETLLLGNAQLPQPLQRFSPRNSAFLRAPSGPQVTFPPEGATLVLDRQGVPLKLRDGRLPLTVLVNGRPVLTNLRRRDALVPFDGEGYSQITVLDADGQSAKVGIRLME